MANQLLSIDMITGESLRTLSNHLQLGKNIKRDFDEEFGKKGYKIGSTLRVRLPNQFTTANGAALAVQEVEEKYVNVTVDNQKHVDFSFDSSELTLDIDKFSERYVKNAAIQLANQIDAAGYAFLGPKIYNYVGTPKTVPSSLLTVLQAEQKLDECLAPQSDDRVMIISPSMNTSMSNAVSTLFNPSNQLGDTYETGYITRQAGFKWMRSSLGYTFTSTVSGTAVYHPGAAGNSLATGVLGVSGFSTGLGNVVSAGTIIDIANVYQVNAQTKGVYANLQQFVVKESSTLVGGAGTLQISPNIIATGAWQNVDAAPVAGATITVRSSNANAFGTMRQNLAFHKDFATLACVPMNLPDGVAFAGRATEDGMSLRIVRQYLIATDTVPCRVDALFGYGMLQPELACRITE